jgi:hypothetical protein
MVVLLLSRDSKGDAKARVSACVRAALEEWVVLIELIELQELEVLRFTSRTAVS